MKTRQQLKTENAILDDVTREISYDKAKLLYNCCVIEYDGDLPDINHTSDIVATWRLEYKDNPTWNVTISNAPTSGQGTTSMRYYRWNLRIKGNSSTTFTYADGTSETKKGYIFGTSAPKCQKYTMKINYASSPQSHKIGSCLLYNDLYKECVNSNHNMAVREAPFMMFQKRGLTYTFVGLGTGGYDKGDKNFFDWNTSHPSLLSLEGPNHDPLGTIFEALWDNGTQYSYRDETLKFGDQEAWDVAYGGSHLDAGTGTYVENETDSADDASYIQALLVSEWKPVYDFIFGCSPYITTRDSVPSVKVLDNQGNVLQVLVGTQWYGWSNSSNSYVAFTPCGGDTAATRNAYFKAHYTDFFDGDSLVFTHCFLQLIAATDNYAKNFYPIKYDTLANGGRWEFRQDDLDSIFDTDNDGVPSKSYTVEFNDKSSTGVGIFQGDVSALWQLVHTNLTTEIRDMYLLIVSALASFATGADTHTAMFNAFNAYYWDNAQNYFPLHSYNADFIYKYYPAWLTQRSYNNVWPLHQALGDRLAQEQEWVRKRFIYELSKYELAGFNTSDADGYGSLEFRPSQSTDITITPAITFYPNANSGGGTNIKPATPRVTAGTPATLHIDVTSGTTLYLKALDYLQSLGDLSNLKLVQQGSGGAVSLSFAGKSLKDITIGGTSPQINVTELQLGNLPCLEVFNAKNVSTLASNIYLQSSPRLTTVDVSGTAVPQLLTTAGSKVNSIKLSPVATILALNVLPKLQDSGIVLSNPEKVRYLLVRNCNGVNPLTWLKQIYNAANSQLSAVGLEWSQVIECVNNDSQIFLDLLTSGDYGRVTGSDDSTIEITEQNPLLKGALHFDSIYAHVLNALNQYSDGLLTITADSIIQPSPEDVNLQVTPLTVQVAENVANSQPITISTAPLLERVIKTFYKHIWTGSQGWRTEADWDSGTTAHGETKSQTYNLTDCAGKLKFDWTVGSEANYDWFTATLDGTQILRKSGSDSGSYESENLTGSHTLVVSYSKDGSASTQPDKATVTNIQYYYSTYVESWEEGTPDGWAVSGASTLVYTPSIAANNNTVVDLVGKWNVKSYYAASAQQDVELNVSRVGMTDFDVDYSQLGSIPQEGDTAILPITLSPATCTKPITHITPSIGTMQSDGWHLTIPSGQTLSATLTNTYDASITKSLSIPINRDLIVNPASLSYSENTTATTSLNILKSRFVTSINQTTTCPDLSVSETQAVFTANVAQNNTTVTDSYNMVTTTDTGASITTPVTVSRVGLTSITIDGPSRGNVGETLTYTIECNSDTTKPLTWLATDTAGATISGNTLTYTVTSSTQQIITIHVYNSIDSTVTVSKQVKLNYQENFLRANTTGTSYIWISKRDSSIDCRYSTDDGSTWQDVPTSSSTKVAFTSEICLAGDNDSQFSSSGTATTIKFSGDNVTLSGSIMSLIDDLGTSTTIPHSGEFAYLFNGSTSLYSVGNILPATTLTQNCYTSMFYGCTSLVTAPSLPATTLAAYCYQSMFYGCTSLTSAPSLPATTIATSCYSSMFQGCTSLTTPPPSLPAMSCAYECYKSMFAYCTSLTSVPALPATTLSSYCYQSMFYGCTSLTSAPSLPATTLSYYGYESMFNGCTSLVTAPSLPATTLVVGCYYSMFLGCVALTTAPSLPATTLTDNCYRNMFYGCTSLTTAPSLPATTLSSYCYQSMFYGCTSLVTAPSLPATTLADSCYNSMFNGCTSLTSAPTLPATSLHSYCYASMFLGCTSLTTPPPSLPAMSCAYECYDSMFNGCTSLTSAPTLPATSLSSYCYQSMFYGCTSLTTAPTLPATTLANNCYEYMFKGCTALTTAPSLPATSLVSSCYNYMFQGCTHLEGPINISATTSPSGNYTGGMFTNSGTSRASGASNVINVPSATASEWNSTNCGIDSTYWTVVGV